MPMIMAGIKLVERLQVVSSVYILRCETDELKFWP